MHRTSFLRRALLTALLAASLAVATPTARAYTDPSRASAAASGLAVAVSAAAPVALLLAGGVLVVAAVQAAADGSVLVLERASDGARASVRLSGRAANGLSVAAGTAVVVTSLATGLLLSAFVDGVERAIAFIPNEAGAALLHSERIVR